MSSSTIARRAATSVAVATIAAGVLAAPASAQDLVVPGCPGFDVGITFGNGAGNPEQVGPRTVLMAGTQEYTLENMESGTTYAVRTAGALKASPGPDGSTVFTVTGPSVLLLFPTDPGGPATTLYQGRLVFNQSADGVTTIESSTGGAVDLCAALGG
jgi:hypothetical protein